MSAKFVPANEIEMGRRETFVAVGTRGQFNSGPNFIYFYQAVGIGTRLPFFVESKWSVPVILDCFFGRACTDKTICIICELIIWNFMQKRKICSHVSWSESLSLNPMY
jgi:hypothetical protein